MVVRDQTKCRPKDCLWWEKYLVPRCRCPDLGHRGRLLESGLGVGHTGKCLVAGPFAHLVQQEATPQRRSALKPTVTPEYTVNLVEGATVAREHREQDEAARPPCLETWVMTLPWLIFYSSLAVMLKLRGRAALPPTDLGTEKPQRPLLQSFPSHLFSRKKGHSAIPSVEAVPAWGIQVKETRTLLPMQNVSRTQWCNFQCNWFSWREACSGNRKGTEQTRCLKPTHLNGHFHLHYLQAGGSHTALFCSWMFSASMNVYSGVTVGFCAEVPRSGGVRHCSCFLNTSLFCSIYLNKWTQHNSHYCVLFVLFRYI